MGRLREARLLAEAPAPQTGGRGRPTAALVPHPDGPLVAVVDISHATWTVTTAAIGGTLAPAHVHRHLGLPAVAVLASVRDALAELHGPRLRAVGVAIPGTVHGHTLVEATNLGWRGVDLRELTDLPLAVGNDASLAGVAEALRGAARDASVALHLTVEVGVGGVLIVDGRPLLGAAGAGGEFGHLPFGDQGRRCPCGAWGCWDLEVDGRAMARHAGGAPGGPAGVRRTDHRHGPRRRRGRRRGVPGDRDGARAWRRRAAQRRRPGRGHPRRSGRGPAVGRGRGTARRGPPRRDGVAPRRPATGPSCGARLQRPGDRRRGERDGPRADRAGARRLRTAESGGDAVVRSAARRAVAGYRPLMGNPADIELWSCAAGTPTGGPAPSPARPPLTPPRPGPSRTARAGQPGRRTPRRSA
ncbi:ROK family protein [Dactylosporangium sp. NBC_01737]|uniref:ROK family protein n=1 Tax=Dactylosporangium sp. NBC_01737 TaxID=2975959 RepID=UPI002E165DDC|nr:ROK family protein [Dactylosporangium sp. NBC_01737]